MSSNFFLNFPGAGVQFSTLNTPVSVDDNFTMANVICMLLLDAFIYALITWYIEAVYPGEFGMPRPLYFPFQVVSVNQFFVESVI